jgi:hypothetical protein
MNTANPEAHKKNLYNFKAIVLCAGFALFLLFSEMSFEINSTKKPPSWMVFP